MLVGFGTRIAALFLIGVMTVPLITARWSELHGVVDLAGTIEVAYLSALVWLLVAGAGGASVIACSRGGVHRDRPRRHRRCVAPREP